MEFSKNKYYKCNNFYCEHHDSPLSGSSIIKQKEECPKCKGTDFSEVTPVKSNPLSSTLVGYIKIAAIIIVAIMAIGAGYYYISQYLKNNRTNQTISNTHDTPDSEIDSITVDSISVDSISVDSITIDSITVDSITVDTLSRTKHKKSDVIIKDAPTKPKPTSLNLPYGVYKGSIKNGKAHGQGTITYNKRTKISEYDIKNTYTTKDQYVTGRFNNGNLIYGKLYNKDHSMAETLNIGKR